ncbi:MAG: hypothetical protein QOE51_2269, partial [Actinoplanes sp.]|nr:hypothetical protein [Actinoplanes sp.]
MEISAPKGRSTGRKLFAVATVLVAVGAT